MKTPQILLTVAFVVAAALAQPSGGSNGGLPAGCQCKHDVLCYKSLSDCQSHTSPVVPHLNNSFADCTSVGRDFFACWETPTKCRTTASCNPQPKCQCKKDIKCFTSIQNCRSGTGAVTPHVTNSNTDCENIGRKFFSCWEDPTVCFTSDNCKPVKSGNGTQDPHFRGFDGSEYYFDGEAGKDYNIVSDAKLQVNARFVRLTQLKGTYMGQVGLLFGAYAITFDPSFGVFFNGSLITAGEFELTDAAFAVESTPEGKPRLVFTDDAWHIVATTAIEQGTKDEAYVNLRVSIIGDVANAHGILGQSANRAANGAAADGAAVEGKESDYVLRDGLLGTDFAYNRFHVAEAQPITAVGTRLRRDVKPRFEAASQ